jgi:lipopolysaccharide exporter
MRGVVGFTRSQIDNLFVSKLFGTSQLGGYNLVREVALLPALSAILPMSEPLLAAIAQGKHDAAILAYRIRLSLALMITALIPLTTFIMLYPELIITVLLGEKWEAYAPLLKPFGLFFFTFCLFELISDAVIAQGRVKMLFLFDVVSTVAIVFILYRWGTASLESMAWLRGWLAVATTGVLLAFLNRQTGFGFLQLFYLCLPVMLASGIAAWSVTRLSVPMFSALLEFLIRGSAFVALAAGLTIMFSWLFLRHREEWQQVVSLAKSNLR